MSGAFSVGDVIEVIHGTARKGYERYIGMEGQIDELFSGTMLDGDPRHRVTMSDGQVLYVAERCLRKKRPPREQVSTWDDVIVWKPREVTHV